MNKKLEDYLDKIDHYLKPMPASERIDIVKEIKSELSELELQNNLTAEEIMDKLGNPKELAKAYLSDSLSKAHTFHWRHLGSVIAFYSLTGISGMFILPVISTLTIAFLIFAIISPIAGFIKLAGSLLGFDVAYIMFQIGAYTASPIAAFFLSIVTGLLFFLASQGLWKLLMSYIRTVSHIKQTL